MSVAALGIGCCFVTAFTASLADAPAAEGGLRGALVNTYHELGGAAGVAMLSAVAGTAMAAAHPAASAFRGGFTAAAACALAAAVIAAFLVPSVLRGADARLTDCPPGTARQSSGQIRAAARPASSSDGKSR